MDRHAMPPTVSSGIETEIVAATRRVVPIVRAAGDEGETLRRAPPHIAEALAKAGLLQMYLPRSMGGPELPPLIVFGAVEELSRADGSIGWCAMIATTVSHSVGLLDAEVGRSMAGCPADMRMAGSIRPMGRARAANGGHRIEGRWDFASGVNHARWLMCPCVIWEDAKPMRTPAGAPMTRIFWVPADRATILDTWRTLGLRGTGSHDFTIEDVFVPEDHSAAMGAPAREEGLLYDSRLHLSWIWTATVGNAIGIARGALDAFADLATSKASTMSTTLLRDRPLVQARVAEAEAILSAARAYVQVAVGDLWTRASQGQAGLDAAIAQARLAITHGMHEAVRSVDLVFHAAGTNAIYERNPLERHFRNIHVAVQHAAGLPAHMEAAGKALLGLRPTDPCW
jgi:alkylation response protein AidB-like acyl-CoA dehydrogenase